MGITNTIRRFVGSLKERKEGDRQFNAVVDAVNAAVFDLNAVPYLQGVLLEDVVLTGAANNFVTHGLGRAWKGFSIHAANAAATYYNPTATYDATQQINIRPSATVTASVWVF